MSTANDRSRDYAASLGLSLAVLAGELPAPAADGSADPWVKVTPRGATTTRDGRAYTFNPEKLVDRFKTDGVDLPADFDHGIALNAIKGVKTPAIGWASDLQARPDGTYAKMDWLPDGKAALASRSHRYISPTFHHDPSGEATWLHSISLTTAPSVSMPALASALGSEAGAALATLAAAVGLPAGADIDAVLKAATRALADAVPKTAHDSAMALASAAQGQLSTLATEVRTREVTTLLDDALHATKILPYQREQYLAICSTDAGLATVKAILATAQPYLRPSGLDGRTAPGKDRPLTAQDIVDKATAYRSDKAKAGLDVTMPEAIAFVGRQPAA